MTIVESVTSPGTRELLSLGQSILNLPADLRSLPDLGGNFRRLVATDGELAGEGDGARFGTVVLFWSAICSHCRRYDERLNSFESEHPIRLRVVASRQNEDAASLKAASASRGLKFPILVDGERQVAKALGVQQTPRAFLFDHRGALLYRGAIDNFKYPRDSDFVAYLDEAIDDLRAGRVVARKETPSFGCPIESVYYQA